MPFEAAANGTIGLETAFPALYHGLVEPGLLELATLVTRMTDGPARAFGLRAPRIDARRACELRALGSRRPLRRRASPTSDRAATTAPSSVARSPVAAGSPSPRARWRIGSPRWSRDRGSPLPRRRHELAGDHRRCRGLRRRRGRVHDGDDRLPGVAHRSELLRTAALLHRADDRQLRRRGVRAGVAGRAGARAALPRGAQRRAVRTHAACSTGCASRASSRSPRSTRARSCDTCAIAARCSRWPSATGAPSPRPARCSRPSRR